MDGIFTFSVNPEQGTICPPVSKDLPFDAPRCSTLVVSFGRSVEIRRPIGGMNPSSKVLAQLDPYTERSRCMTMRMKLGNYKRFRSESSTCLVTARIPSLGTPNQVRLRTRFSSGPSEERNNSPVFMKLTSCTTSYILVWTPCNRSTGITSSSMRAAIVWISSVNFSSC